MTIAEDTSVGKKNHGKTQNLSLTIELPDNHNGLILRKVGETLQLVNESGEIVTPKSVNRSVYHQKDNGKGIKFRSKSEIATRALSISGLPELAELDYFFAIDTNSRIINGVKVSATFLAKYRLQKYADGYRLHQSGTPPHLLEMYNCSGNPELAAILEIALEEQASQRALAPNYDFKVGFITDTELGLHNAINNGLTPVYGQKFLPNGFSLIYSSSDTGSEMTNTLIKACDKAASNHLNNRMANGFKISKPQHLKCDANVMCRYNLHSMTISTDPVPYIEVNEGTRASIIFEGEDGRTETHEINWS